MVVLVAGVVWAGLAVAVMVLVLRQVAATTTEVVRATAEAMWGPRTLPQPEAVPLPQPEEAPSMFPAWEEEPWLMEEQVPGASPSSDSPS